MWVLLHGGSDDESNQIERSKDSPTKVERTKENQQSIVNSQLRMLEVGYKVQVPQSEGNLDLSWHMKFFISCNGLQVSKNQRQKWHKTRLPQHHMWILAFDTTFVQSCDACQKDSIEAGCLWCTQHAALFIHVVSTCHLQLNSCATCTNREVYLRAKQSYCRLCVRQ